MGHPDYRTCRGCGRRTNKAGSLSWTRLCRACADKALEENIGGLMEHSGPAFQRWRKGMAASVGGVILDDASVKP